MLVLCEQCDGTGEPPENNGAPRECPVCAGFGFWLACDRCFERIFRSQERESHNNTDYCLDCELECQPREEATPAEPYRCLRGEQ